MDVGAGLPYFTVLVVKGPFPLLVVVDQGAFTLQTAVFVPAPVGAVLEIQGGLQGAVVVPGLPQTGFFPVLVAAFAGFVAVGMVVGPQAVGLPVYHPSLLTFFSIVPIINLILGKNCIAHRT